MKLGIIGLPQSGKSTIFSALTGARGEQAPQGASRSDPRIGMVRVMDHRLDFLIEMYRPKKRTYAQVEYLLPSATHGSASSKSEGALWNQIRGCDAIIHVTRNFKVFGGLAPSPEDDFQRLEEDMIINDLVVVEKKIERIALDMKRGNREDQSVYPLIKSCLELLEKNLPIRMNPDLVSAPLLRGFTFLSAKPQLLVINNEDEDESLPGWKSKPEGVDRILVRGKIEMEIASMAPEEAEEFLLEYHIQKSALDRVIQKSYALLNLISFFTVGEDEVKAWTIKNDTPAVEAAGAVHSDIQQGFIRAEILSFDDLKVSGSFQEAKKAGTVRLEGKEYIVKDGDIINFRFNV